MSKSEDHPEKMEMVNIQVTRKRIDEMFEQQHEKFSRTHLARQGQGMVAFYHVTAAIALLSVTTKEKAKEAFYKANYNPIFMRARAAAEALGNPKDLQSYRDFETEGLETNDFIPPVEVLEETKTRFVGQIHICPYAESLREFAENFPNIVTKDVLEVALCRCDALDVARANGFNSDMKYKRIHFMLADLIGGPPSKACCFEMEVAE